ncbi:MAG: outer membrane lipoprotein carrier protein LolA [Thermodesulfobacteriota bacterium]
MAKDKKIILYILLAVALVAPQRVQAAAAPDNNGDLPLLEEIQNRAAQVKSFSCKFTQERHLAIFSQPVIFHGFLYLIRPDHLRWEFRDPIPSLLLFSGDKGMRCNDDAPPVHFDLKSDPVMRLVAEQLWTWLDGNYTKLGETYDVKQQGDATLVITPKDAAMASFIATITITFARENRQPELVKISEPGGDMTLIRFHDYNLDAHLPKKLFVECGAGE